MKASPGHNKGFRDRSMMRGMAAYDAKQAALKAAEEIYLCWAKQWKYAVTAIPSKVWFGEEMAWYREHGAATPFLTRGEAEVEAAKRIADSAMAAGGGK